MFLSLCDSVTDRAGTDGTDEIVTSSLSVLDINTSVTWLEETVVDVVVVVTIVVEDVVDDDDVVDVDVEVTQVFQLFSGVAERSRSQGGRGWRLVVAGLLTGWGREQV